MDTAPLLDQGALARRARCAGRAAAAVLLAAHAAIHLMGVVLLWELGEPGDLTRTDAVPEPGTASAWIAGAGWALAAAGVALTAVWVARADPRWPYAGLAASVPSLAVMAPMAGAAPVGLVVSAAVLIASVATLALRARR